MVMHSQIIYLKNSTKVIIELGSSQEDLESFTTISFRNNAGERIISAKIECHKSIPNNAHGFHLEKKEN